MGRYSGSILYEYNQDEVVPILKLALENLGFKPVVMDVYFAPSSKNLSEISYDEEYLLSLIRKGATHVLIKNQLYDPFDRMSNLWFRFRITVGDFTGFDSLSLEWSNNDLDFLLARNVQSAFFSIRHLVYCYCYDQYDMMDQSNTDIEYFKVTYPGEQLKLIKDHHGLDIVDVSDHGGRMLHSQGRSFVAAPVMWIGDLFEFIPKIEFLNFRFAKPETYGPNELIFIKLFDLYDPPSKEENRAVQKEFWHYFNVQQRVLDFENSHPVNFFKWFAGNHLKNGAGKIKRKVKGMTPMDFGNVQYCGEDILVYENLSEVGQSSPVVGSLSINGKPITGYRFGGPVLYDEKNIYAPVYIKRFFVLGFKLAVIDRISLSVKILGKAKGLIFLDKIEEEKIYFYEDISKERYVYYTLP